MRILAIETSGAGGSAAVAEGPSLIAEASLPGQRRSTQTLTPAIQTLLTTASWRPSDLELIGVSIGPGSFTGLRLGVATTKMLAYATGAAVLGIDTLRCIAAQASAREGVIVPTLDAGRGEVLVGHFRIETTETPQAVAETRLLSVDDWLAQLAELSPTLDAGFRVTGPGLRMMANRIPNSFRLEAEANWEPRAATIARVAWHDFSAGRRDDAWSLAPIYYRRSAAEERLKLDE